MNRFAAITRARCLPSIWPNRRSDAQRERHPPAALEPFLMLPRTGDPRLEPAGAALGPFVHRAPLR